uniref:small cell adhesion glycoprotein-like n=1 Tax=Doryrhamphus excisus TaxID=161450 RepID=UPI0025AEACE9|nr:small cell adhesion glycoprotein-like [Doryrhamphus excisus]
MEPEPTHAIVNGTAASPTGTVDTTVVAVVVTLILLTVVMLAFLLYCYMCHNKGDYRTTGEPAPGQDPDDDDDEDGERRPQAAGAKKEYFI